MKKCELWTIQVQKDQTSEEPNKCSIIVWQGFKITGSKGNSLSLTNGVELKATEIKSQKDRLYKANALEPKEVAGSLMTNPLNGRYKKGLLIPESQLSEPVCSDILVLIDFGDCSVWRLENFSMDILEEKIIAYKELVLNGRPSYYWMICQLKNGEDIQIAGEIFRNECGVLKKS